MPPIHDSPRVRLPDLCRFVLAVLAVLATLCLLTLLLMSCTSGSSTDGRYRQIILIDRTGVAQVETWQSEVATQTAAAVHRALDEGVAQVDLAAIGSNTDQAATVATADLTGIEGNTEAKRDAARQALVDDIATAAAEIASQPVDTAGTDVFAALDQAASLCQAPEVSECSVLVISDLEDQRVTGAPSAEEAANALRPLMPDLTGISVQVSGLGASGADAATVQKVRAAWVVLFDQASAVDVRIARSL